MLCFSFCQTDHDLKILGGKNEVVRPSLYRQWLIQFTKERNYLDLSSVCEARFTKKGLFKDINEIVNFFLVQLANKS